MVALTSPLQELPSLRDHARGALLGAALGDALGAPFEGQAQVTDDDLDKVLHAATPLTWTDDTSLTLAVADHLLQTLTDRDDDLEQTTLAGTLAAFWAAEPDRGFGAGAVEVFTQIKNGTPWSTAAGSLFGGAGSFGNGGAMRVAPLALVEADPATLAGLARRSAAVTHAHVLAQAGAAVQAVGVRLALDAALGSGTGPGPTDPAGFVAAVRAAACASGPCAQLDAALQAVPDLVAANADPQHIATRLGNGVGALESVPTALAAFLSSPDAPAEALRFAILCGGDTDTIASMTGALAGAWCGVRALPAELLHRLEDAHRIGDLAEELVELAVTR